MKLTTIPMFDKIKKSKNILISGCGGGFDIFTGIPLYFALKNNYNVYLANYSFTNNFGNAKRITNICYEVDKSTISNGSYFPEKYLCSWFQTQNIDMSIYCFEKTGVVPLIHAYQEIIKINNIDTILLVDGGTDSLMKGNEKSLGSPTEDSTSIAAVNYIKGIDKYLLCLGFGVDSFHGINHYLFLENVSELIKNNGFYGTFSILKDMDEFKKYKDACKYVYSYMNYPSIVNSSICDATDGYFGNYHSTDRTNGNKLFINHLMSIYWCFDLDKVANNCLYLSKIINTKTYEEVREAIHKFCYMIKQNNKTRNDQILPI